MNDSDADLVKQVVETQNAIINGLPKEQQFHLVPLIKTIIEKIAVEHTSEPNLYKKKVQTLKVLEIKEGVKSLVEVIQTSIMHGQISVRVDAAICFKYIIDFAKPDAIKAQIIKICGALIRVVNDKFPQELKLQIMLALKLI
eukprot:CAMPEP_0176396670 /NCGR_PEP_ID=MMETSP0126-20121128/44453_1 /TAXON_ID=141414 ORGANISM="Strombidinopsis acuminatum, Strain SPMC142" /NCGR_SAMPLE_ID=MMETSP0126 /ASSEMBLY_ACC=CAM_ASM_000229 /LENGTH=141 /DNA_ID=CAMNT_0017770405 /DNA_START=1290 /DNA_END=1715 /DNA_ORIENTATION=-